MLEITNNPLFIPLLITFIAGISTGIGSLIPLFFKKFNKKLLLLSLGLSAGVMVYVSFAELLPEAVDMLGFTRANIAFFIGVGFMMLIDFLIPHHYIAEDNLIDKDKNDDEKVKRAGIFTAIGMAIHNFPEGIAVFMSALIDVNLGIALAIAVALHNIPEGIAISSPIYYATKSKKKAFWYSFLSGVAEPLGAVIAAIFLMKYITPVVLAYSLAFVAGVMVFISFDELLPLGFKGEENHLSVLGVFIGMLVMALTLALL
jgi:zinc transporter, ZIP family